jgi:hypothetical protein
MTDGKTKALIAICEECVLASKYAEENMEKDMPNVMIRLLFVLPVIYDIAKEGLENA